MITWFPGKKTLMSKQDFLGKNCKKSPLPNFLPCSMPNSNSPYLLFSKECHISNFNSNRTKKENHSKTIFTAKVLPQTHNSSPPSRPPLKTTSPTNSTITLLQLSHPEFPPSKLSRTYQDLPKVSTVAGWRQIASSSVSPTTLSYLMLNRPRLKQAVYIHRFPVSSSLLGW